MQTHQFFKPSTSGTINIIDENQKQFHLSTEQAEKKFDIKWTEFPETAIENNYDKLQVRYMGGKLGWGLFTLKDFNEGERIGVFSGDVSFQPRSQKLTSSHIFLSDAPDNQFQVIDASNAGNLTRFIQHLPTAAVLDKITFNDPQTKEKVATCNIKHNIIQLSENIKTEEYVAQRAIKTGEILGSSYHEMAWLDKTPLLLEKDGTIIESSHYSYPQKNTTITSFNNIFSN